MIVIAGGLIIGGFTRIALGLNIELFPPPIRALSVAGGIISTGSRRHRASVHLRVFSILIVSLITLLAPGLLFAGGTGDRHRGRKTSADMAQSPD